jgi:hypothetical protein
MPGWGQTAGWNYAPPVSPSAAGGIAADTGNIVPSHTVAADPGGGGGDSAGQALAGAIQGQDAASAGLYDYNQALLTNNYVNAGLSSDLQRQLINHSQDIGLQGIGLSEQELGIQRGALDRQGPLMAQQHDLVDQLFGIDSAALGRQAQLSTNLYNIDKGTIQRHQALNDVNQDIFGKLFGLELEGLGQQFTTENRDLREQAATQGAMQSEGFGNKTKDIYDTFKRNVTTADYHAQQQMLQFAETKASLTEQMAKLGLGYGEQQAALADSWAKLQIQHKSQNLTYGEQQAQLQDRYKNLDIAAQRLGLSRQDLEFRTQNALAQLGINDANTANDYAQGLADLAAGRISDQANLASQINQIMGF